MSNTYLVGSIQEFLSLHPDNNDIEELSRAMCADRISVRACETVSLAQPGAEHPYDEEDLTSEDSLYGIYTLSESEYADYRRSGGAWSYITPEEFIRTSADIAASTA